MRVGATVAALGTPAVDGEPGLLRTANCEELLLWNDAQKAWVSRRPKVSMKQIGPYGMDMSGNASTWGYPAGNDTGSGADNAWGFQIHAQPHARELWDAGLRLQEHLSALMWGSGASDLRIALNWYDLDPGDDFLSPAPTNFGVPLFAPTDVLVGNASHRRFVSTGWQNSPIAAPVKRGLYPEIYSRGTGDEQWRHFTALHRWAAGVLGGLGGADPSDSGYPPNKAMLYSWHVADAIAKADGSPVENWTDWSGFDRHLVQAAAGKRPVLIRNVVNGHAVVRFDGVDDVLRTLTGVIAQPYTIVLVVKQFAGGAAQQIWTTGGASVVPLLYRADATDQVDLWLGSGGDLLYHRGQAWPSPFMAITAVCNGANTKLYENTTQKAAGDTGAGGIGGLAIGAHGGNESLPAQIDVAEVLVYFEALSDANRVAVANYLNAKYALF